MKNEAKYMHIKDRFLSQLILLVILVTSFTALSFTSPYFNSLYNIGTILDQSSMNIIIGISMTFIICSGGIDLSVGSTAALSGVIMSMALHSDIPIGVSLLLAILLGALCGLINGIIVSIININPFITTISTMWIYRALTLIITRSTPIYGFPEVLTKIGTIKIYQIPLIFIIALFIVIIGYILFNKSVYGNYTIALGVSEESLTRVGVKSKLYKVSLYIFSGLMASIVGILLTSKLNCADPLAGNMLEMEAITVAILGGTSIKGGKASILGTLLAGLLIGILRNGLIMNGIAAYYQQLAVGLILLASVILSEKRRKLN